MHVYGSCCMCSFFFFKQKTAYEMRISDWSSDVCSSDLREKTRLTTVRNFGISGFIEQDDAEAWQGIQRVAQGPVGRRLTAKYQAQLGIVHPDDFEGGGDVYAGFSRDDAQWAWWKRYAEGMGGQSDRKSTRLNASH